ncbi:MAG: hypothetical protein VYA34_10715 [Myxococcota bacterium]|nr:hypothetical protein [Myxococcota bacterium]
MAECGAIYWVVALSAEAKCIVKYFGLKRTQGRLPFPLYQDSDGSNQLVVSGAGRMAAAAATAYLAGRNTDSDTAGWINLGIAGHKDFELGHLVRANRVSATNEKRSWYPVLPFKSSIQGYSALTVDLPTKGYPTEAVVEMEAYGFLGVTTLVAGVELGHCLKVISDNESHHWEELDRFKIEELMAKSWDEVVSFSEKIREISREEKSLVVENPRLKEMSSRFRLSVTQKNRLRHVLTRVDVLVLEGLSFPESLLDEASNGKDLLRKLEAWADEAFSMSDML